MPLDDISPEVSSNQQLACTMNSKQFTSHHAVRDGRQLLEMTGFTPPSDHVLIEITHPGARVIGLDVEVNLSEPGREAFWAFLSDREFNFTVDEAGYVWGAPTISEEMLRTITKTPVDKELVLERKDGEDAVIKAGTDVNLAARGTEHIYTETRLVTVYYADDPFELERGTYTGAKLLGTFPVPTGYVLDLVLPGEFKEIVPNDKVKLREGMRFVSHPPSGQSS